MLTSDAAWIVTAPVVPSIAFATLTDPAVDWKFTAPVVATVGVDTVPPDLTEIFPLPAKRPSVAAVVTVPAVAVTLIAPFSVTMLLFTLTLLPAVSETDPLAVPIALRPICAFTLMSVPAVTASADAAPGFVIDWLMSTCPAVAPIVMLLPVPVTAPFSTTDPPVDVTFITPPDSSPAVSVPFEFTVIAPVPAYSPVPPANVVAPFVVDSPIAPLSVLIDALTPIVSAALRVTAPPGVPPVASMRAFTAMSSPAVAVTDAPLRRLSTAALMLTS